jgi:hypothetical protein
MDKPARGLTLGMKVGESVFIDKGRIKITLLDKPGRKFARLRVSAGENVDIFSGDGGASPSSTLPQPPRSKKS